MPNWIPNVSQGFINDSCGQNPLTRNGYNISFATDRYGNPNSAFYLQGTLAAWTLSKWLNATEFTFSLWINVLDSSKDFRILAISQHAIILDVKDKAFHFSYNVGQQKHPRHVFDKDPIKNNTWYKLDFVVSQTYITLYKNGYGVGHANFISNFSVYTLGGLNFIIGTNGLYDGSSNDIIDDIQLFNRALSPNEIQSNKILIFLDLNYIFLQVIKF